MNKKLQKGLSTAMAAAMGAGIVVPTLSVMAANTTNGWVKAGSAWYYLKSGKKATGWVKDGATWYLLDSNGAMVTTGWKSVNNVWYYLNANGAMQTGWKSINGTWYYMNSAGAMQTGWKSVDGTWYFMATSGAMATSKWVGNYYVTASGAMAKNTVTPDGFTVDANGLWDGKPSNSKPVVGDLAVTSVSATSANTIAVTFNQVPTDASKLAFAVAQSTSAVAVTTSWNSAGTVVTLTKAAKFTAGTYTVNVKNDTKDLGTSNVTITEQKIAKINITSTKLGVHTDQKTSAQKGYVTYTILDQYGVDITNGALANNVTFQTGVGTTDAKKGLITITPANGLNLLTFSSGVTIIGNDTSTGVSGQATLAVTSQSGTLASINLTGLTNVDNKVLTAGDTTDIFYAAFTATDISGNPTSNYTLMKEGLIFNGNGNDQSLATTSPYVTAKLIQDPKDSNQGVIEVRVINTLDKLSVDMPVTITAMTWTGSNSQINTTLKKQAEVYTFNLLSPNDSIASNESKNIEFAAADQNGVALTKFSDFSSDLVTFSNLIATRNVDGTLCLKNKPMDNSNGSATVPEVLTANTKAGKYSTITINIQKPTKADTLTLDTSVLNTTMQEAKGTDAPAMQFADFGWDNGGLKLTDQYGRAIDINSTENSDTYKNYKVVATSSNPSSIVVGSTPAGGAGGLDDGSATGVAGIGQNEIAIKSVAAGSSTVRFDVYDISQKNAAGQLIFNGTNYADLSSIDSKTQTFTVLKDDDIKDYTIDQLTKPIYVINPIGNKTITDLEQAYKARPKVYGTTSTGAKVVLRGTPITGASVSNSDFTVYQGAVGSGNVNYKGVRVIANKLADPAKTGSSAVLTVTLLGADGNSYTKTTPITSSTVDPLATTIDASVNTYIPGISRTDDVVTITPTGTDTYNSLLGSSLAEFNAAGYQGGADIAHGSDVTNNVYFSPTDQYGQDAWPLSQFLLVNTAVGTSLKAGSDFKVNPTTGALTNAAGTGAYVVQSGDFVTVTANTSNGLSKTIKIVFAGNSVAPVVANKAALTTAIQTATTTAAGITVGTAVGNCPQGAKDTFIAAIATAQAVADKAAATQTEVDGAVATLATAKTTFESTIVKDANVLTGTMTTDIFGNKVVKVTVTDGTKVTGVTLNGNALVSGDKYVVSGNDVKVIVSAKTDTVKITVNAVVYTVNIQ